MLKKIPKHIVRLLLLLGIFLLAGLIARNWLVDPSFYKFGHYRADVVSELAAPLPLFKGAEYCRSCHDEKQYDTSAGKHTGVQCEVCHGTSREHPDGGSMVLPSETVRLCSSCHEEMPARPARQPQVVTAKHPSADEVTSRCQLCHNPHLPQEGPVISESVELEAAAATDLSGLISKCARCHGKQGEGRRKNPPLAGMDAMVFIEKMREFKAGTEAGNKMNKYAKPLSDSEIMEIAHYYENLVTGLVEDSSE
jgi:cytochrome c553